MLKKSEIIREYRDAIENEIIECMVETADTAIRNNSITQYQVYIWSDGEIEMLFGPEGDNSFLKAKEWEDRELYYVGTVSGRGVQEDFNSWAFLYEDADKEETPVWESVYEDKEEANDEVIEDYLAYFGGSDWVKETAAGIVDAAIERAEWEE